MGASQHKSFELPAAVFELLGRGGAPAETRLSGVSMEPTLPDGCRIRIRPVPTTGPRVGEVVLVAANAGFGFAHRVVAIGRGPMSRGYVITRGDATPWCDRPVPSEQLVGVVFEHSIENEWRRPGSRPRSRGRHRLAMAVSEWGVRLLLEVHARPAGLFARLVSRAGAVAARVT